MKGFFNTGYWFTQTIKGVLQYGGGAFLVFSFIITYSVLNISGWLYQFLDRYSVLSTSDFALTFNAPIVAVCLAYLSILIKRAACFYLSTNYRNMVSYQLTLQILVMLCLTLISVNEIIIHIPMVSTQRLHAISVLVCLVMMGTALFIHTKTHKPFDTDSIEIEFREWYPKRKYKCHVKAGVYNRIVNMISHIHFLAVALITTATFTMH